jgi:hypothetical protein
MVIKNAEITPPPGFSQTGKVKGVKRGKEDVKRI